MGTSSNPTIGYRYYMGLLMGICRGQVDSLLAIEVGGREAWSRHLLGPIDGPDSGMIEDGYFPITAGELFGGDSGEGGISGDAYLMRGSPSQVLPQKVQGAMAPMAYQPFLRGTTTLFFDGLISTLNPYAKPWKFKVRRVFSGWQNNVPWYPEKAAIDIYFDVDLEGIPWPRMIRSMNPAHIIYQTLTDKSWGRGLSPNKLDVQSFINCADKLFEENFGLCIRWNRRTSIQAFIQTILDHVGGILRQDKITGLYKMVLVRKDFEIDDLPIYTPKDVILEVREASSGAVYGVVNEVIVTYHDPVNNELAQVKANNIAAVQIAGSTATVTREYPAVPTADLALRLAQRDLKASSTSLRRLTAVFSRAAWKLQPGDVFVFQDTSRFIDYTVMRVATVEEAGTNDGKLLVTALQDVFSLAQTSFAGSQPGTGGPVIPSGPPPLPADMIAPPAPAPAPEPAIKGYMGYEQAYVEIARRLSPGDFSVWPSTAGMINYHMAKPSATALGVRIDITSDVPVFNNAGSGEFTPFVLLTFDLEPLDENNIAFYFSSEAQLVTNGMLAVIGDEMVRLTAIDTILRRISIERGVADTIPQRHVAGTPVWFVQDAGATDSRARSPGVPVTIAGRPRNSFGSPIVSADITVNLDQRFNRPYPPGNVRHRLGDEPSTPWFVPAVFDGVAGSLVLSWAHRDRLLQSDQLIGHTEGDVGPEPEVTYTIRILDAVGTVKAEHTGIAGNSFVYDHITAILDLEVTGDEPKTGTIELFAMRDTLASRQMYEIPLTVEPSVPYLLSSDDKILTSSDDFIFIGAE